MGKLGKDLMVVLILRQAKINKLVFAGDQVCFYSAQDRYFAARRGTGVVCSVTEWGIEIRPDDPREADERLWVPDATWLWFMDGEHAGPKPARTPDEIARHRAA